MGREVSRACAMCSVSIFNPPFHRTPYAILDDQRRIIAVLAGRPYSRDGVSDDWDDVGVRAFAAIEAARKEMHFDAVDLEHRRGPHIGKACGWSHGLGQEVRVGDPFRRIPLIALPIQHPMRLQQSKHNAAVWARLFEHPDIKRVAGFGSGK
jgi:hypothetical protein